MTNTEKVKNALQEQEEKSLTKTSKGKSIFDLIREMKPQFEMALGKMMSCDRFTRIVVTVLKQTPKLASCNVPSLMGALMQSAQLGLEPNTPTGQAYLIPFLNRKQDTIDCQFQIGYKGLIELFYRHQNSLSLIAEVVYENDEFEYELGLEPKLIHKPLMTGDRGNPITYYSIVKLKNGGYGFAVMSIIDIKEHAKQYSKAYQKGWTSPWKTNFDAMALKTVIKKALKFMPMSIEFSNAVLSDETIKEIPKNIDAGIDMSMIADQTDYEVLNSNIDPEPEKTEKQNRTRKPKKEKIKTPDPEEKEIESEKSISELKAEIAKIFYFLNENEIGGYDVDSTAKSTLERFTHETDLSKCNNSKDLQKLKYYLLQVKVAEQKEEDDF